MKRSSIILFICLIVICAIFLLLGVWVLFSPQQTPSSSPTPTPITNIPKNTTQSGESSYPNSQYVTGSIRKLNSLIEKNAHDKAGNIIKLRESLPYKSPNFFLRYDIDTNQYLVTISASNRSIGEKELNDYFAKFDLPKDAVELKITYE